VLYCFRKELLNFSFDQQNINHQSKFQLSSEFQFFLYLLVLTEYQELLPSLLNELHFPINLIYKMSDDEGTKVEKSVAGSKKKFEVKKWNAVALWAWGRFHVELNGSGFGLVDY
jgi:hypothetical protein